MSHVKSKAFLALQKEWDKKLKASGFEDIEDRKSNGDQLAKWDSFYFSCRFSTDTFEAQEEYFSRARDLCNSYKFSCWLEKAVWENHAQGLSLREIVRKLRNKENKLNKDKAFGFIKKIKKDVWGHD